MQLSQFALLLPSLQIPANNTQTILIQAFNARSDMERSADPWSRGAPSDGAPAPESVRDPTTGVQTLVFFN